MRTSGDVETDNTSVEAADSFDHENADGNGDVEVQHHERVGVRVGVEQSAKSSQYYMIREYYATIETIFLFFQFPKELVVGTPNERDIFSG